MTPMKLDVVDQRMEDDGMIITARLEIKSLIKRFAKGFNTITITDVAESARPSTTLIVDIEV